MKKLTTAEVVERGVEEILPSAKELARAMRGKKIRLYFGVDPTSPYLHIGHAVPLRKLRQFQELGHEVILLFGTFTAQIGDPTGRDAQRQPLTEQEIRSNMATYKKQAGKILDLSQVRILRNGAWLKKLSFADVLSLSSHFTTSQFLERDMFQERIKNGKEVWVSELLYPLMQGYDSVAMDVDLEIGGTDQTFNMLMGRRMQRIFNNKEKYVLTTPLLLGLDGRKMSKSFGNAVNILDPPEEMYGKLMSMRDNLIMSYFELCTDVSQKEIARLEKDLEQGAVAPRDAKARLAREITAIYHSESKARAAEKEFTRVFREKQRPAEIPAVRVRKKEMRLIDLLIETRLAPSRSEARRLVEQGGVRVNDEVQSNPQELLRAQKGMILQAGKRRFVRIV